LMAGHVSPEAAMGGPIAFLCDGDKVTFDVAKRRLDVDADLAERARAAPFVRPLPNVGRGVMAKYRVLVSSASEGATTGPEGIQS
jgi:dihydroxy-acid dehydratase